MADKQKRLERIRAAKAALEAEAAAPPADDPADDGERPGPSSGIQDGGRPKRAPDGGPPPRAQRNFTDPDSRIHKTRDGFVQGYNAQAAVDGHRQIVTAWRLTTSGGDQGGVVPLVDATRAACGRRPKVVSGDAGLASEANLAALAARGIGGYPMPGRARHGVAGDIGRRRIEEGTRMAAMALKLRHAGRRSRYRLRKQIALPVFGQIKQARGFRRLLLRGFDRVRAAWGLICTVHNLAEPLDHQRRRPRAAAARARSNPDVAGFQHRAQHHTDRPSH